MVCAIRDELPPHLVRPAAAGKINNNIVIN